MPENTESETDLAALREEIAQLKGCITALELENASLMKRAAQRPAAAVTLVEDDDDDEIEVDIETDTLVVGRDCHIEGSIRAEELIVYGTVDGRIEAASVSLASTARVSGELLHGTLAVETGAFVEARIRQVARETTAKIAEHPAVRNAPAQTPERETTPAREEVKDPAPKAAQGDEDKNAPTKTPARETVVAEEPAPRPAIVTPLAVIAQPMPAPARPAVSQPERPAAQAAPAAASAAADRGTTDGAPFLKIGNAGERMRTRLDNG